MSQSTQYPGLKELRCHVEEGNSTSCFSLSSRYLSLLEAWCIGVPSPASHTMKKTKKPKKQNKKKPSLGLIWKRTKNQIHPLQLNGIWSIRIGFTPKLNVRLKVTLDAMARVGEGLCGKIHEEIEEVIQSETLVMCLHRQSMCMLLSKDCKPFLFWSPAGHVKPYKGAVFFYPLNI